jgi:hypothetical protein
LTADPLFSPDAVRALLIAAAREGRAVSYSELLAELGHRFTRPRMRALCKLLDKVDEAGAAAGEPELAVLVVRESDGLPGQGWWVARADLAGHTGDWTGPDARALVRELQGQAFDYWRGQKGCEDRMSQLDKLIRRFLDDQKLSFAEFRSVLEAYGWRLERVRGSHHVYRHKLAPRPLPIEPDGKDARAYQLRQARAMIERYGMDRQP